MTSLLRDVARAGLAALMVLAPNPVAGQGDGAHPAPSTGYWGISVAAMHQSIHDEIASPLRQSGSGPALGLVYTVRGTRSTWGIDVAYASPSLAAASSAASASEKTHEASLGFAYLRRVVGSEASPLAVFAGAGSKIRLIVRTHYYDGRGSELYADFFAPVELQGLWEYATGRTGAISGRLAASLFSVVVRDPYAGAKYLPGAELADPLRVPMLRHVLSYRFRIGASFAAVLSHELGYVRYPAPRHLALATQDVRLTLEWHR